MHYLSMVGMLFGMALGMTISLRSSNASAVAIIWFSAFLFIIAPLFALGSSLTSIAEILISATFPDSVTEPLFFLSISLAVGWMIGKGLLSSR